MKLLLENWRQYLKESHPSPSADYISSHPRFEDVRNAIRNNEDLGNLGIDPSELYKLVSFISDEEEFDDDDRLLDVLMDLFNKSNREEDI
jgi:hypothetical protein